MHRSEGASHFGPQIIEAPAGAPGGLTESERKGNWDRLSEAIKVLANPRLRTASVDPRDEVRVGFLRTFKQEVGGEILPGNLTVSGGLKKVEEGALNFMGKIVANVGDAVDIYEKLPDGGDKKRIRNYLGRLLEVIVKATDSEPVKLYGKGLVLKGVERLKLFDESAISLAAEPELEEKVEIPTKGGRVEDGEKTSGDLNTVLLERLVKAVEGKGSAGLTGSGMTGGGMMEQYLRDIAEYNKRRGRLESNVETVSLTEILDAYVRIKAPRERQPQMWEYFVPEWANGMDLADWRSLLSYEDKWLGAIYNKNGDSAYNNDLQKMKEGILNKESLFEEDLKQWYESPVLNLRGVMHIVMRELLVPVTFTDMVDGKPISKKVYQFETEQDPDDKPGRKRYKSQHVRDFVENAGLYKMGLAKRLKSKYGVVKNEEAGKLAVALAMDMMEMGGVFSLADVLRRLGWEADAVRIAQQPNTKYSAKVGSGEIWGGPWTEYGLALAGGDVRAANGILENLRIVPKLLSGSFLDLIPRGQKRSLAERIYNDEKIDFNEASNDLFFSWRKDHIMPAVDLWLYITRKNPFEMSKVREFDNVVTEWRTALYNGISQLRQNNDALVPVSVIAGAIGGSVGLWPFAGPYLRLTQMHGDTGGFGKYCSIANQMLEGLGLGEKEKQELKNFFGIDLKYAIDFQNRLTDYGTILNPRTSERNKRRLSGDLRKPR